jgi:hypothetical protein
MAWVALGSAAIGAGGAIGAAALSKKKKSGASSYDFKPYSGMKPPRIDYTDASGSPVEILRPTQKQDFDITMRRSLGQDVGYDPSWMSSATALTKNELGRAKEDNLRAQKGSLSAAGLSGNPRAYEATAGRVERNYSTDLENSLNRLNVANMEASRSDKNAATERLATLNQNNFGQENKAADFDLRAYLGEEGIRRGAFTADLLGQEYYDGQEEGDAEGAGMLGKNMTDTISPSLQALLTSKGGTGIAPGYSNFDPSMSTSGGGFRQTGSIRKLAR